VISFDTNQVFGRAPDGTLIRMLHKVAEQTSHELMLPEIAVEEYLAHYRHKVEVIAKRAKDAVDDLRNLAPDWHGRVPSLLSVGEMAEKSRREKLEQIFRIHPTPAGAWREALSREARRRRPAKTSWDAPGTGARDVVVWLTVVDACRAVADAATYFVTANSSDFGKDGSLWPELLRDFDDQLGQNAGLFHYCADIPMLMGQLGIERVRPPDDDSIGHAEPVCTAVEAALADTTAFIEFLDGIADLPLDGVGAFNGVQNLRFERLQDKVEAYRIGEDVWSCARGEWAGWKDFTVGLVRSAPSRRLRLDFTVNATVVMQLDAQGAIVDAEATDRSRLLVV
jgi:PIN domain